MKPTDPRSAYRIQRILDLLLDGDLDQKALTGRLGMTRPHSIAAYLTHLRTRGRIHIRSWTPRGRNGHTWAIYKLGRGVDAPCPPPPTGAQHTQQWKYRKGLRARPAPRNVAGIFDQLLKP